MLVKLNEHRSIISQKEKFSGRSIHTSKHTYQQRICNKIFFSWHHNDIESSKTSKIIDIIHKSRNVLSKQYLSTCKSKLERLSCCQKHAVRENCRKGRYGHTSPLLTDNKNQVFTSLIFLISCVLCINISIIYLIPYFATFLRRKRNKCAL